MSPVPFAVGTFSAANGAVLTGLVLDQGVLDLGRELPGATLRSILDSWDESLNTLQAIADRAPPGPLDYPLGSLRPLPPVSPPGQLFQAGANYREHLVELTKAGPDRMHRDMTDDERRRALETIDERARTGVPYIFLGLPHSIVGAEDDIVLPNGIKSVDWELELAAIIGRPARHVPRSRALDVVAGYTICNDITARDRIFRDDVTGIGTDWFAGKNWPTFFPTGPVFVPAVHAGDPMALRITLKVNGQVMQDSTSADMMFDIARLIEHASSIAELRPGDMLLTGSPAGNGVYHGRFLQPGDLIESEITGLGKQRNRCVAESQGRLSPTEQKEEAHV